MNPSDIEERFSTFGESTVDAIQRYNRNPDPSLVETIVEGIVQRYLPAEMRSRAPEAMKSLNGFGIESVTLMEIFLDIQDALGLQISDRELRTLTNFADATRLLMQKVAEVAGKS